MEKDNLTREQAVALAGESLVAVADAAIAEYSNRVGHNGSVQGDDCTEFAVVARAGNICVTVYYYSSAEDHDNAGEDLPALDRTPTGYEVA